MSRGQRITASPPSDPPAPFAAEETRGRRDRGDQPPRVVFDPLDWCDQCCREPLRRALETQKPQIVESGKLGGVPFVARAHPLTFDCDKHRRACRSLSMQLEAKNLLHSSICSPLDCDQGARDLWHPHSPDKCETPTWANLEGQLEDLYDDTDRGGWCVWVCDGSNRRYLGACVFFEFGRSSLRGRPSLKSEFHRACGSVRRGRAPAWQQAAGGVFHRPRTSSVLPSVGHNLRCPHASTAGARIDASSPPWIAIVSTRLPVARFEFRDNLRALAPRRAISMAHGQFGTA